RQIVEDADPSRRGLWGAAMHAQLALADGDFVRAEALLDQESAALEAHPAARTEYHPHLTLALQRVRMRLETGDAAGARDAARAFTRRAASLAVENPLLHGVDLSLYLSRVALGPGAAVESERRAWIDGRLGLGAYRGTLWAYAHAAPALTPEEARAA